MLKNALNSKIQAEDEQKILIISVGRGFSDAKAGLQAGNVLTELNNQRMTKGNVLQQPVDLEMELVVICNWIFNIMGRVWH